MTSKKTEIKIHKLEDLAKNIVNIPEIYQEMQQELVKHKDFASRLEIVVDTIENIFRAKNKQPLLSYSEFKKLRKNKLRNIKNHKYKKEQKRWKKRRRR